MRLTALFLILLAASGCKKEITPKNYIQDDLKIVFADGSMHWYRYASGEEKIFVWRGEEDIPSEVYDLKRGERLR